MMASSEIYKILLDHYGPPRWWSDDPYTVIVQAVLVQNTAWKNVEKTTAQMQEKLSPDFIASVPIDELEALIRSCGFYKAKARTIKTLTEWYIRKEEIIRQYSDEALRQEKVQTAPGVQLLHLREGHSVSHHFVPDLTGLFNVRSFKLSDFHASALFSSPELLKRRPVMGRAACKYPFWPQTGLSRRTRR